MVKIALIGAAGQIGTPLSLLCKSSDFFDEISLYDLVHAPGIATDLNHIDTRAKVAGYLAENSGLTKALTGADVVVVTAGIARKPGMTRDDLFKTNASIILNSTLPIAAETLKKTGVFEPTRLFGVTTLDVVRASTFAAHAIGNDSSPKDFKVPVVGGHSGATILPLYSQAEPSVSLRDEILAGLINRVQFGGDEIAILKARSGEPAVEEAYVYLPGIPGGKEIAAELSIDYFAVKIELGKMGAIKALPIGKISDNETKIFGVAIEELKKNIATALAFMSS
ncbi:hypothetical protein PENSTE_c005G01759 [Penicillium steckii]|uniref:malate dehydrogenase n=1 Tax=Penicillium steckii TaxID=303698 RepID=A0A1V6TIY0_9EURO|nr:hypothetical protein PENSTE_c005G01759 [Penicillium steckii]